MLLICVVPGGLSGALVIKHVGIGDKAVGLDTIYLDAENTTRDHHSDFRVLTERELSEFRDFLANKVVVSLDINNFLFNLIKEGAALEDLLFLIGKEDREVRIGLRQYVDIDIPFGVRFPTLLHNKGAQERVLGRNKSLSEALLEHFLSHW